MRPPLLALALTLTLAPTLPAQPQHIAPTNALSPADERASFTVPNGFDVQLVAAEPDIQKPMQIAFDAKGRLWVTTSHLYPFPAEHGKGTDKLFVLSDFGPDGKAKKVETFAANLNIPIGVLPLPDCKSCLVSSAGVILKLTDTDGDGKADKTEELFTGFGSKDTHGMVNSFTLMPDGWVHACHGYANESTVKGKDGHGVKMQSGNTFRFRPDGSRIEVFTRGQVNPFGMAVDPWFNLYTADCHSKPITQLIPGAVYQSFAKPHDGLGFAPHVTRHDHGSTALCGLSWYDADHFPKEYRGCMFLGNVVTNRINADRIVWHGSTPEAKELPDFLVSRDPWFRPTDIKLGPDGALYVADFYNKIIGHYEVDLKHPARDKDRGRVWRIVWTGQGEPGASATGASAPKPPRADWTTATEPELLADVKQSPNLTVRSIARLELIRRLRKDGDPYPETASYRLTQLIKADEQDVPNAILDFRVTVASGNRLTAEWDATRARLTTTADPRLQRAWVEAMATRLHADNVKPLAELIRKCPPADTHLMHAARVALRNTLLGDNTSWGKVATLPAADAGVVTDIVLGVPTSEAAGYLEQLIQKDRIPNGLWPAVAEHIGRHGRGAEYVTLVKHALESEKDRVRGLATVQALVHGFQAGGRRVATDIGDPILRRVRADLTEGPPELRLAALKLLGDIAPVLRSNYTFRGRDDVDPIPVAVRVLADVAQPEHVRAAVLEPLFRLDPKLALSNAVELIDTQPTPPAVREKAALLLAGSNDLNHKQAAKDAIKDVPYRSGVAVATALASSKDGSEVLFIAVKQGKAPARLLQEKEILDKLRASGVSDWASQVADLTKGLQPADQKLAALIKQRTARFPAAKTDKELGAKLFTKHCAACHQIGGQGNKIGPQLDGIGNRGLERLLEDVLDPNRNVDAEFRARVLSLADGRTLTGLMLRVEGEVVVFADELGKEFRIPTKDIEKNRETTLSPMPANFGETIPEADFHHLTAYLLDQRAKDPPPKK